MAKTGKAAKGAVTPRQRMAGLAVHLFTASGAVLGFLALLAALEDRYAAMFGWLVVAQAVDAVDGTLARRANVARTAPEFSGDALDLVVDYVTYVLVPAYAMYRAGLFPDGIGLGVAALILLTSALYFADVRMKTADWHFRGFPAVWNLFAFLAFVWRPEPWLAAALAILFSVLTFMPVRFAHPLRVAQFRMLNLAMLGVTTVLCGLALWWELEPPLAVKAGLGAAALYFLTIGLVRRG